MTYGQMMLLLGIVLMGGAILLALVFTLFYTIRKRYLKQKLYDKYGI